jgi:AraC-like DNA-binding protein
MNAALNREQTKYWQAPDLGNLELLRATYITHAFTRHTHQGYAIGVVERGAETFYYRGGIHVAPAGSIVVINPGEAHTGQAVDKRGWSYRMLYPEIALLQQAALEVSRQWQHLPDFPNPVIHDSYLAYLLRRLHIVLESSTSQTERETHFYSVMAQLIARHAEGYHNLNGVHSSQHAVYRAKEYLETHFTKNISLTELAKISNLSHYHFVRVFRDIVGLPPHAYLTQIRVERAKTLLAQAWPIAHVATETGFVDQSHLTRHFKRIVGVTPGQYLLGK